MAVALEGDRRRGSGIGLVYKTSFDKANRTSAKSNRGIGLEAALPIFAEIRSSLGVPVLTDVHESEQCARVAEVGRRAADPGVPLPADRSSGRRGRDRPRRQRQEGPVPGALGHGATWSPRSPAPAIRNVLVTERGASFGYNTLVSDMRALPILARTTGAPVIFDATHSVQQPGGQGTSSGGEREFVPVLARAAVAVGVAGVFIETHQDPDKAPSDGPNMVPLKEMEGLLAHADRIRPAGKGALTAQSRKSASTAHPARPENRLPGRVRVDAVHARRRSGRFRRSPPISWST